MNKHVIDDAQRCLQCKKPLCVQGCPVNTPIRDVINLLLDSKLEEAGKILFENNPLSIVCSLICPQENQCEGHCVLGKKGMPVQISAIEHYISDYYLNIYKPKVSLKNREKVAIIGSGPAGITIAFLLAQKNYDVTIYEGTDKIGGILRYGIPEFRLPKNILDRIMNILIASGVKIRPNTTIGVSVTIDELLRDGFRAIFMGTGVWRPLKLGIVGESLGHVHFAIEYLRNPSAYQLGKTVMIIGAGNVAMDVARTAIRFGARDVTIICNRDESTITATPVELKYAIIEGVKLEFNKTAIEFVDDGAILCDSLVEEDENGKIKVTPIKETAQLYEADAIIIAISQGPRSVIVSSTTGIQVKDNGLVVTDECGRTSFDGVFASGDVVTGAKTVVEAVKVSKRVADAMDKYITEKYSS